MSITFCGREIRLTSLAIPLFVIRVGAITTALVAVWVKFFSEKPVELAFLPGRTTFVIVNGLHQVIAVALLFVLWKLLHQPDYLKLGLYSSHRIFEGVGIIVTYANPKNFQDDKSDSFSVPLVQIISSAAQNSILVVECIILLKIFFLIRSGKLQRMVILPEDKCKEFFKGNKSLKAMESQNNCTKPYIKTYEVDKRKLKIDENIVLGQGVHGVVLKGTYVLGKQSLPVAIKVYQTDDSERLSSAMTELKMLMYMDQHENVLNLIKASTKNISWGEIHLLTPLCHKGDLDSFLRKNKHKFSINCSNARYYENVDGCVSLTDLMKYSIETASALEFLSSKHIVHGDLSARNILLTQDNVVKVTDFGLSHHLYNYKLYKHQSSDCELPWRWMAPESLTDLKFSVKSDVWSFGVTLWEIFSLGDTPYEGKDWDFGFTLELMAGFRLSKPLHCNDELYENVMIPCWHTEDIQRYLFSKLLELLKNHHQKEDVHISI